MEGDCLHTRHIPILHYVCSNVYKCCNILWEMKSPILLWGGEYIVTQQKVRYTALLLVYMFLQGLKAEFQWFTAIYGIECSILVIITHEWQLRQGMCQYFTQHKKKPVTTMLTYPWKCTVLHCNHLGNTWKPLVLMTWHFDYCPSASEGDNQSVGSSAPVVSRCFPGGYNVKLYISRGRLAWWLLAFLHSVSSWNISLQLNAIRIFRVSMSCTHAVRKI